MGAIRNDATGKTARLRERFRRPAMDHRHHPGTWTRMPDAAREVSLDREVAAPHHPEPLTRAETAIVPGITEADGARRSIRALEKLEAIQAARADGLEGR